MLKSLYARLAIVLLAILVLVGGLFFIAGLMSVRSFLDEVHQKLNRELAEHLVADSLPMENGEIRSEELEHIFHVLMVINPSIEVYLLDTRGQILSYSAPKGIVVRDHVELAPVFEYLEADSRLPILGDDPRDPDGSKVFSAAPIGSGTNPDGFLYVVLAGQQWDSAVAMLQGSYMLRLGAAAVGTGLFVALVIGLLTFAWITRRARRLELAMAQFRESEFREHHPVTRQLDSPKDEIDRLAHTFDAMAERLVAQLEEFEKTDLLRRELVTNISHDLRTPLTSLRGFLETLDLKGPTLSPEDRKSYLEGAIRQADRLNRLVADLFELARLESGTQEMEVESLALAELAQDAAQQFQLQADERGVDLKVEIPTGPAMVDGDMGLLARVLDNLLDNGLRHTSNGGKVTLGLQETPRGISVEVSDTGCGIAPDDLPRVFDRFFQEKERDPVGDHAGLGLAITKRIVELHGGLIEVRSQLGQGTTFSVTLPTQTSAM
jgi:two-component system OmpR family sensor kinase